MATTFISDQSHGLSPSSATKTSATTFISDQPHGLPLLSITKAGIALLFCSLLGFGTFFFSFYSLKLSKSSKKTSTLIKMALRGLNSISWLTEKSNTKYWYLICSKNFFYWKITLPFALTTLGLKVNTSLLNRVWKKKKKWKNIVL